MEIYEKQKNRYQLCLLLFNNNVDLKNNKVNQVFFRRFRDPIRVPKIRENRVPTSDGVSRLGLGRDASRDPFFEVSVSVSKVSGLVSVSVSKDFGLGLELFVSRLCIGYFL